MKVNISVFGRFHAFDLAKQLNRFGVLNKLITTYPKFKANEWGIESKKVISEFQLEILNRINQKLNIKSDRLTNYLKSLHAKNSSKYLDNCDIFIGWSGSSLEMLTLAKEKDIITILERGSSHYSHQQNILKDEYEKFGLKFNSNLQNWERELIEYELADYISIPSTFVKKTFIDQGISEDKLIVNPYGVDLENFKQVPKKDSLFRIIYAGQGSLQKGYHYLLQAFHELDLKNSELWHLGNITNEIKPFLEKYKNPKWIFKGNIKQNELYKFYSQGSIFILPSIQDGFGMVILQAMSCGLPVILSQNTAGNDIIENNKKTRDGFVVPIRDVSSIKQKILFLYNNQKKAIEMGNLAKKKVQNNYSWNNYGERYFKNLKRIIDNKIKKIM